MSTARAAILDRIRAGLTDVPESEVSDDVAVLRNYLVTDPLPDLEGRIHRFVERVSEYRAKVHRVDQHALPGRIASICESRNVRTLVVPDGIPVDWVPPGISILRDDSLSNDQLNTSDGVLTGCALGVAQTGTIVLDRGPDQGRRALSLLPDYHLCVIFEDQVVGIIPEAVTALKATQGRPDRPMTWISGPSATSDIELNRVEGVHGPRTLEVLVVRRG